MDSGKCVQAYISFKNKMPSAENNDGSLYLMKINKVPQSFIFPTHQIRGKADKEYDHDVFYLCLIPE
jgi:hypothetical protein